VEIDFLSIDDIKQLHADQLALYGGMDGVRDEAMLDSAIHQPQSTFAGKYLHEFPNEMAAAYLYHLVMTIRSWMEISAPASLLHSLFLISMATK
jgi:prophage maintenance system killer protein